MCHFDFRVTIITAPCYAERGITKASCLSVRRLSVTLRYRGHVRWNSWKIISHWLALRFFSLQTPTSRIYSKGTTPNFSRNRSGVWTNWLWEYKPVNIFETVEDTAKVTINRLYIKSYTDVRLPPKYVTLNDFWARFKAIDSLNAAKLIKNGE